MKKNNFLFAVLLTLPMVVFFAAHYFHHIPELEATGFIQHDNVSYVANAKQYLDGENRGIFYSNPLNHRPESFAYFQPQNFIIAALLKVGLPPGLALVLFVLGWAVVCFYFIIKIFDHLAPGAKYRKAGIVLFSWGGGLLAMSGVLAQHFMAPGDLDFFDRIFILDYGWGWWGLNLGRSLFFSMEAYYHALFLAAAYCLLTQRWKTALTLALLLSASHPFTGIEWLLIAGGWIFWEKIICRNKQMPWYFAIGMGIITALHLLYYLVYLNRFADHHAVSEQYALDWHYSFYHFIPAYCIVALLAFIAIRLSPGIKQFFQSSQQRLFICWAVIAFLLANHHWFMKPMQPIHFTRGYVWSGLFLLGLPGLLWLIEKLQQRRWLLVIFMMIFLSDNILWITNYSRFTINQPSVTHTSLGQRQILNWLAQHSSTNTLVIGSDETIPYLATVYAKASPWISHEFTTPFYKEKRAQYDAFITSGTMPAAWNGRQLVFIFLKQKENEMQRAAALPGRVVHEDAVYRVVVQ